MSGLLDAARVGDLVRMQRLIREGASIHEVDTGRMNALFYATLRGHTPIMHWALKEGGARTSDVDRHGRTVLSMAIVFGRFSLVQWLQEEGGANITDTAAIRGERRSVWDLVVDKLKANIFLVGAGSQSMLKVMVLLGDAPPDFIPWMSPQDTEIALALRVGRFALCDRRTWSSSWPQSMHIVPCLSSFS
jgi:ankyrin repeat protein